MEFPLKPKTPYILKTEQDQRIFDKLNKLSTKKLAKEKENWVNFLYTQLEDDWRTPLEKFIDKLLED